MKNLLLAALAAAFLAAGCAAPSTAADEPVVEREYTTGSNIPRKAGDNRTATKTIDRDAIERTTGTYSQPATVGNTRP